MNQKNRICRSRQGFTMMELLTVVAIIAILAAISMPAIIAAKKNLEMAKMDEYARQIYLAAQNEAMKMKASGELAKFYKEVEAGHKSDWNLGQIKARPADYADGDSTWSLLYYIPSDEEITKKHFLQPTSSLSEAVQNGGSFMMEMNPLTGDIYSMFYSEQDIAYSDVTSLISRERKDRKAYKIGYYCGAAGNSATALPGSFTPSVSFRNEDELWVDITCPGMLRVNSTQRNLRLEITIKDQHHEEPWTKTYLGGRSGDNGFFITGDQLKVSVLLDSLEAGKGFYDITEGKLTPGDDITVEAAMRYVNGDISIEGKAQAAENSLFQYRKTDDTGAMGIGVKNVRHLNNLRASKYDHSEYGTPTTITQTADINFDPAKGYNAKDKLGGLFPPIDNPSLFRPDCTFEGNNNRLMLFTIENTSGPTGLFAKLNDVTLQNIRMEDCSVTGANQTGALAGAMTEGAVINCGIYISTKDEFGRYKDMTVRVNTYQVKGEAQTGGLIGYAHNTSALGCYGAVSVSGTTSIGGLIGFQSGGSVKYSYASGDTTASSGNGGGLIGTADGSSQVSNSYSTSNIQAPEFAGGLIGSSNSVTVTDCRVYGKITSPGSYGGITGSNAGSDFKDCYYLSQAQYNDKPTITPSGTHSRLFVELKSKESNSLASSEPYDSQLVGSGFPFPLIAYKNGDTDYKLIHYGNWPLELKLQTSLVYYERYDDNHTPDSYGYYALTSLKASGESGDSVEEGELNAWKVDTLRDQTCLEDGYAIMTPYDLTKFDYKLNADTTTGKKAEGTIKIGTQKKDAILLDSNASIKFTKENGTEVIEYEVKNARVYRLPFSLQMTEREKADRFYDQLKMTGFVSDNKVFEDYTFYYCPDFAKNAINPSLTGDTDAICPKDPDYRKNMEDYVFVRSARQLNALGRTPYYWNEVNNSAVNADDKKRELYFKQETDINFSTYTKDYCGETFDLMDTSYDNHYRNVPIGRTNEASDKYKNFRYTYDGSRKQIVDYRCVTYKQDNLQFTGLFGEIQYAALKNINMIASDPDRDSGYVESQFIDDGAANRRKAGVGALLGLAWVKPNDSPLTQPMVATVENCSVSGYRVTYTTNTAYTDVSVGGLVGFSFGYIRRSTAVNKVTEIKINEVNLKSPPRIGLGGLLGSIEGFGMVEYCYAGGNLEIDIPKVAKNSRSGGICGTNFGIPGYKDNSAKVSNSYSYCTWDSEKIFPKNDLLLFGITFDELNTTACYYLKDTIGADITFSSSDISHSLDIDGLSSLSSTDFGSAGLDNTWPWSGDEKQLSGKPYPFPAVINDAPDQDGAVVYAHYGSWPLKKNEAAGAYLCYYERYKGHYGYYYINESGDDIDSLDYNNEHTIEEWGYGILCPESRNFEVLYDMYDKNSLPDVSRSQGNTVITNTAITSENGYFLYPFEDKFKKEFVDVKGTWQPARALGLIYTDKNGTEVTQKLSLNTHFGAAIFNKILEEKEPRKVQVRADDQLQMLQKEQYDNYWTFEQTHFITASSGTGFLKNNSPGYTYDGKNNTIYGLQKPLFDLNGGAIQNVNLENVHITGNVEGKSPYGALAVSNIAQITNCHVKGEINMEGPVAGFVGTNTGTIQKCSFTGTGTVQSTTSTAAGFCNKSTAGSIQLSFANATTVANGDPGVTDTMNPQTVDELMESVSAAGFAISGGNTADCFSIGTVTSRYGNASGFLSSQTNQVTRCYANSKVSGVNAAGFAYKAGGPIDDCYAVGTLNARDNAAGFIYGGWGTVNRCYTIAEIQSGTSRYGFSTKDIHSENSLYWVSTSGFNNNTNDGGIAIKLNSFYALMNRKEQLGKTWTTDNQGHTIPDQLPAGSVYPYPRLNTLDHYGDWPSDSTGVPYVREQFGVFQVMITYDPYAQQYIIGAGLNEYLGKAVNYTSSSALQWDSKKYGVFFYAPDKNPETIKGWKAIYFYHKNSEDGKKEEETLTIVDHSGSFMNIDNSNYIICSFSPGDGQGNYTMEEIQIISPKSRVYHFTINNDGSVIYAGTK